MCTLPVDQSAKSLGWEFMTVSQAGSAVESVESVSLTREQLYDLVWSESKRTNTAPLGRAVRAPEGRSGIGLRGCRCRERPHPPSTRPEQECPYPREQRYEPDANVAPARGQEDVGPA